MGATATQLPAAQQKPSQLCRAEPSSPNRPCLALLCCPHGCAKVSWSDTRTHTRPRDLALLPGYRVLCRSTVPRSCPGSATGWYLTSRPSSSPPQTHCLGTGHLGPALTLKKTRGKPVPTPRRDAPTLATATRTAQDQCRCSWCCQRPSLSCHGCPHAHILARDPCQPPEFCQQPWCRGELCAPHPLHPPATAGPSQGDLRDKKISGPAAPTPLPKPQGGHSPLGQA